MSLVRYMSRNMTKPTEGENNSRRNMKGFMSRKSKENAIKIENRVQ